MPTQEIALNRWSDFEGEIQSRIADPSPQLRPWLFRGLANSCWGLETTLERSWPGERSFQDYYTKAFVTKAALESFTGRRWDLALNPLQFAEYLRNNCSVTPASILTDQRYEYLVYLRHHGFPSPLLDWTASPYVAAFFAFDDVAPESIDRVCVYAVLPRPDPSSDPADRQCAFLGPRVRTHERHYLQQCWYSLCTGMDPDYNWMCRPQEAAMVPDNFGPVVKEPVKFTIPARERTTVLRRLDLMNINRFSLFRSEDSLVRTVAWRELG
jgi:hypothetical protein